MTVEQLIKKLRKIEDKNLRVFWADHDHGTYESNAEARIVEYIDMNDRKEWEKDKEWDDMPKQYIIIRP